MKYYLHDSNAFNDDKITELYINFGYEGVGLFYVILEKLAQQEKPVKTSVLKHQLKIGKKLEKCWNFIESLELISSSNGETFNKQLLNFSEKYKIKKEKNAEKISQWRKNQDVTKNVTSYEPSCNAPKVKESKVKESKVKESKVNIIDKKESEIFNFTKSMSNLIIDYQILSEWLKIRKAKNLVNTETAFKAIVKQIELSKLTPNEAIKKAVEKSWGGFEAKWLEKDIPTAAKKSNFYLEPNQKYEKF
jgi:hypothetical protein